MFARADKSVRHKALCSGRNKAEFNTASDCRAATAAVPAEGKRIDSRGEWINVLPSGNVVKLEASFCFEADGKIGAFSKAFVKQIAARFRSAYLQGGVARGVERAD